MHCNIAVIIRSRIPNDTSSKHPSNTSIFAKNNTAIVIIIIIIIVTTSLHDN